MRVDVQVGVGHEAEVGVFVAVEVERLPALRLHHRVLAHGAVSAVVCMHARGHS